MVFQQADTLMTPDLQLEAYSGITFIQPTLKPGQLWKQ
jgi:hypothetical protein